MPHSERHIILRPAQLRGLAFLFASLFLLGMGRAFEPEPRVNPERGAIAYQAHTDACKAAVLYTDLLSGPDILRILQHPGIVRPAITVVYNQSYLSVLSGQAADGFVLPTGVKRYILFSCQKIEGPLVSEA